MLISTQLANNDEPIYIAFLSGKLKIILFFKLQTLLPLSYQIPCYKLRDKYKSWAYGYSCQHIEQMNPKRNNAIECIVGRHFNALLARTYCYTDKTIVMPTVSSCSTQVCKVLVLLLQSDVDAHIETRGIGGLWGIYSFMYIIIYIINYNEYIVMYNIESHSLTITSTTWLNNVPHWYTNCKCTDKKALHEVNEVAYAQRAINSLFFFTLF